MCSKKSRPQNLYIPILSSILVYVVRFTSLKADDNTEDDIIGSLLLCLGLTFSSNGKDWLSFRKLQNIFT